MGQHFIVPSIRGRDIGFLKWPDIRSFKHLLELLDFIDYAFNVHPEQYSEPALSRHFHFGVIPTFLPQSKLTTPNAWVLRPFRQDSHI